jgi:hypothetical protein
VGVLVSNPAKVGRDAGDLAGIARTSVIATTDVDARCSRCVPMPSSTPR